MAPIDLLSDTYTLISRASGSGSGGGGGGGRGGSSSSSGSSRSSSSGSKGGYYGGSGGSGSGNGKGKNAWVKFGKHWVRRWQFGLIVTAIVLAGIALLIVGYMVWKRKYGKKVATGGNREWGKYMAGLRRKNANESVVGGEGGVGAKEMNSDSDSDEERKKARDSGVGHRV